MLNIRTGTELKAPLETLRQYLCHCGAGPLHKDQQHVAEEVKHDGHPDEALLRRLFDVDATNPEGGGDQHDECVGNHAAAYHGDSIGVPAQAHRQEQPRCEVESN
jgi:hypothetical protein